jgi:AcrR family transcriptional regulator
MNTLARHIRVIADALPGAQRTLTSTQLERQALIMATGRIAMARYGRATIAMPEFSMGLRLTPAQIRWHFPDLDNLFGAICRDHLKNLFAAINEAVAYANDPDPCQAARAAYFGFTRTALGTFNEAHTLFLRDRHTLPEDEAASVNATYNRLPQSLGGEHGWYALELLNRENLTLADVENAIAELANTAIANTAIATIELANTAIAGTAPPARSTPTIVEATPAGHDTPHQFPRHIRRKIEALRRQRRRREQK